MVLLLKQRFPSEKLLSIYIVIIWSWPVSVTREQSALWWRRTSTTSSRPPSAATCKGVQPAKNLLLTLDHCCHYSRNKHTTTSCVYEHGIRWQSSHPSPPRCSSPVHRSPTSTSSPLLSSLATSSTWKESPKILICHLSLLSSIHQLHPTLRSKLR